jgi:sorbitol-6-phosphate 2-dehydrogenase
MSTDRRTLINTVAPALRGLLGDGCALPIVHLDKDVSDDTNALKFQPPKRKDDIIVALRQLISDADVRPQSVYVPELGTFKIVEPARDSGRFSGKVAVVTGAAQGFGLEIARDLIDQGGYVCLADINADGAKVAAESINDSYGAGRALGLSVDVANSESVAEMIYQTVCEYGGFDLFLSNAGILKAGSVKTQSEADFNLVTAVNYKGYFMCVQKAAPVLAVQHIANPEYSSDIIQINSKSGLVGSNKNGAYAGSKFGGIGLTQSFALELIDDGIKVNAVCPGNFFDGPLWSDPQNGLFARYLRTGKVPGAKTIEDVRKSYEDRVPMKRGCTTEDVMKAVYYIIDQQYETGQAIPVTGGQTMLS